MSAKASPQIVNTGKTAIVHTPRCVTCRWSRTERGSIAWAVKVYGVDSEQQLQQMIERADWSRFLIIADGFLYQDYVVPTFPVHAATGRPVFANMLVHNSQLRPFYGSIYDFLNRYNLLWPMLDPFVAVFERLPERLSRVPHPFGVPMYPTFDNDRVVPRWVVRELQRQYVRHEVPVPWQTNDIIVIDNTRMMHGHQAVVDDERRILTRVGFPTWSQP